MTMSEEATLTYIRSEHIYTKLTGGRLDGDVRRGDVRLWREGDAARCTEYM